MGDFLNSLDYRKKDMFHDLPSEKKNMIKSMPSDKQKKRALVLFSDKENGVNARNRWVLGLNGLRKILTDSNYFLELKKELQNKNIKEEYFSIVDTVLDFDAGEFEGEKNTDPSVYALLASGVKKFKECGYDKMAYNDWVSHRTPMKNSAPVNNILTATGLRLKKERIANNLTQSELALACDVSRRTIKNIESGQPVSTETFFKVLARLDMSTSLEKVHFETENISERKRVKHKQKS